jgi:hypothetical protein
MGRAYLVSEPNLNSLIKTNMQKNGWIKLYPKLWDNPHSTDPDWVSLWIYILCHASFKPTPALWKGKRITLQTGQFVTNRKELAESTGISESKVYRLLICYESEQQIEQQNSNRSSLITVLNWNAYQQTEQQFEQQMNNRRTTEPSHTILERNKNIRIKEEEEKKESKKERNGGASPPAHKAREFFNQYQDKGEGYTGLIDTIALKRNLPPEIVRAELDKFCLYWTEKNHNGTKVRWEMEKVFEVERRLTTWFSRAHKTQQKPVGVFIS